MTYKFYLLLCLIILLQTVKGITMTKKEVLKLDLKQYSNTDKCPEFSNGIGLNGFSCSFTFYCNDDNNCQSDKNDTSPYFEFTEKDGSIKKYIKKICSKTYFQDLDCTTEKCTTDSDCLSNRCFNSTCISGKSLFTECSDINDDSDYDNQVQIMKCGKMEGEPCTYDKQCSGRCFGSMNCRSHVNITPAVPLHIEPLLYIAAGIIVLLILLCICCCCICC